MSDSMPVFGRRRREELEAAAAMPALAAAPAAAPAPEVSRFPADTSTSVRAEIAELRNMCLARMDATAVAALPPERLLIEVERLISDLATDKRVQLNAREQRALAT